MVNLYGIQNAAVICTRNNPEMNGNASNKGNSRLLNTLRFGVCTDELNN